MGKFRGIDKGPGRVNRVTRDLQRQVSEANSAKRLESATIGRGGLTVKDGGGISVLGGVLRSAFIFLESQLRPEGVRTTNGDPSNSWTATAGSIGNDPLGNSVTGILGSNVAIRFVTDHP